MTITIPNEKYSEAAKLLRSIGIEVSAPTLKDEEVVYYNIIRRRDCEHKIFTNTIVMVVPKGVPIEDPEELLRERIRQYLATKAGWKANCIASQDYNWGDFMMDMSRPEYGLYFSDEAKRMGAPLRFYHDMQVNQDELLAPTDVPAKVVLKDSSGSKPPCTLDGTINFQTGEVWWDFDSDDENVSAFDSAVAILENHEELELDKDDGFERLKSIGY